MNGSMQVAPTDPPIGRRVRNVAAAAALALAVGIGLNQLLTEGLHQLAGRVPSLFGMGGVISSPRGNSSLAITAVITVLIGVVIGRLLAARVQRHAAVVAAAVALSFSFFLALAVGHNEMAIPVQQADGGVLTFMTNRVGTFSRPSLSFDLIGSATVVIWAVLGTRLGRKARI